MKKKAVLWGVAILFFAAVVWGLHLQEGYMDLGDAVVRSINSKETVEKVELKRAEDGETISFKNKKSVQELFNSIWKAELKLEKGGSPEVEYELTLHTDAGKSYQMVVGEKEIQIRDNFFEVMEKGRVTSALSRYFE